MALQLSGLKTERSVRPIFIIGAPRSATSAMVWALGQHSNIQPMPETGWIASMGVGAYLSYLKGSERGKFSHLSNVEFPLAPFLERIGESVDAVVNDVFALRCEKFYGDYREIGRIPTRVNQPNENLQLLRSVDDPKQRWIDGTPMNSYYIWILSMMFPHAMFIHNLRAPEDVATSLEGFATVGADPQPLHDGVQTWIEHTENAWLAERAFGANRVFRADFHRVAQDPVGLVRDVLRFLGEDFEEDCLLPLARRINSSEVDSRREANMERLRDVRVFQTAEALYRQISESRTGPESDETAASIIKQRFMDYCYERSLV